MVRKRRLRMQKTGKVTAVVAVMYLNGKTKVKLQSINSQKSKILIGTEWPLALSKTLIVRKKARP